jgi:hypothetical protein
MAVIDDVRRLMQLDFLFLGLAYSGPGSPGGTVVTVWHKGRIQQANDGSFIFRSISQDGTVVGVQLGPVLPGLWFSQESVSGGIQVQISVNGTPLSLAIQLWQSLPQELT